MCSMQQVWAGKYVVHYVVPLVCKACTLPFKVSWHPPVQDAIASCAAQPQKLLVPPARCSRVPVLSRARRRVGVQELGNLQNIAQRGAVHKVWFLTGSSIEIPSKEYDPFQALKFHHLLCYCLKQVLVSIW